MCKLTEMIMQTHGSPILVEAVNDVFCKTSSPIPKESLEAIQTEIGTFRYLMMHYRNNQAIVDPYSSMWWDHKKLIENMLNTFFKKSSATIDKFTNSRSSVALSSDGVNVNSSDDV